MVCEEGWLSTRVPAFVGCCGCYTTGISISLLRIGDIDWERNMAD